MGKEYAWQVVVQQETNHGTRVIPLASFLTAADAGDYIMRIEAAGKEIDFIVDYNDILIRRAF